MMGWGAQATSHYPWQCWPDGCCHMVTMGHNELILQVLNCLEKTKIYLHLPLCLHTEMAEVAEIVLSGKQVHVCWWPGDAMCQEISSHNIDLVIMEYSTLNIRDVTLLCTSSNSISYQWSWSTLVQAWCHQAKSHYLNQCWSETFTQYSLTIFEFMSLKWYSPNQARWIDNNNLDADVMGVNCTSGEPVIG